MPAVLAAAVVAALTAGGPVRAASGDVYKKGTQWCASTYPGHGTLGGYGPALDLNGKGGVNDLGWPIFAPEDGHVSIYSEGYGSGWGNSIIWKSADGSERMHMAHLDSFGHRGDVAAGELIGRVGKTGEATGPHLHVSARRNGEPAEVELMGKIIKAGHCYVSIGPIAPMCLGQPATILGGGGDNVLVGTAGTDVIVALGGADEIRGLVGPDLICGGGGKDVIYGNAGEDRARGDDGADIIRGGPGADRLKGKVGPDTLSGAGGPDRLFGEPGNDRVRGQAGADRLSGGPGSDTASFAGAPGKVSVAIAEGTASGDGVDTLIAVESAHGSKYADDLIGDDGANHLAGAAGNDLLKGKGGEDALDGGQGDDTCTGGEEVIACDP